LSTTIGRQSFTVLFGMGSGVTPDVSAPENQIRSCPIKLSDIQFSTNDAGLSPVPLADEDCVMGRRIYTFRFDGYEHI
jgi:hypothetical protein